MKRRKRLLAGLLSLALVLSLFSGWPERAYAAPAGAAGSIGLTVRFDLPQTRAAVEARNLTLTLSRGSEQVVVPLSGGQATRNDLQLPVSVTAKNTAGTAMTTEARLGYYEAVISGLSAGVTYDLRLTGTDYVPYATQVTLGSYSQHLIVGTGDGTFALGDVDGDGAVTERDLTYLDSRLGQSGGSCDLNGDGAVDVTDLAYVNYLLDVTGQAERLETAAIVSTSVEEGGLRYLTGSAGELFTGEGTVTVAPAAAGSELAIPIVLASAVEMSEIVITSPDGVGAVQAGTAEVETADGAVETFPFDTAAPAGVHAIGATVGERVVTIDLGRRVAVKKVTIKVTQVAGQTGAQPEFATVTEIEFLKDIVPENPKNDADKVTGLTAKAGNGQVELAWSAVRNVTGYEVAYGASRSELSQTLSVSGNRALVTALENLKEYFFQVTAVNGAWRGTPSDIISATPQPGSAPGAPSNIRVEAGDQFLRLSWGRTKEAVYYQVFIREYGSGSEFVQFGGDLTATSTVITGLTNGVTYELAVKAGNDRGVGPYSASATGKPDREEIETPVLPTDGRIPSSEIVSIQAPHPDYYDHGLCPNFTTRDLIDGDAATFWVARAFWENSVFTYTFAEPHDMNYFIMVPYLQGAHKTCIARYKLTARDENGDVLFSGMYNAPALNDQNYMVMPFPTLKGVKSLAIGLDQKTGGNACVSISEIAFYNSDSLPDDVEALFTDRSFTQLKSTVEEAGIAALEARLAEKDGFYLADGLKKELAIARGLLEGDSSVLGLVKNDFQSRSGAKDASYGQSASDLQPLGITARAGATVAIYAEIPEGEAVSVIPTQFYGESGVWKGAAIPLHSGRNYINIPQIGSLEAERGGPLYITYSAGQPDAVKLHVIPNGSAAVMPVLELAGWYDMTPEQRRSAITSYVVALEAHVAGLSGEKIQLDTRNATEISTPSVLLSLPADQILSGLKGAGSDTAQMAEALYQDVLAWEETLFVANRVQGIIPSGQKLDETYRYPMTTRQNIRYMRMFAGAFMYAAGNHVGIGYGSAAALAQGRPTSNESPMLFGWGIAHEIGHNMDKLGRAEITNNIYSLAVQTWDGGDMTGNQTRLTGSGVWQRVYDKVSAGRPGAAGDVFVQLGLYWQLHLAYDGADEPLKFYNDFFTAWKRGDYRAYSYDERVALIASQTAGYDLSEFCARWGMTLGEEAKAALAALGLEKEKRAIWYLNDDSRNARLDGASGGVGTPAATASVEESKVTLTVTGGAAGSVLGYEVRRNGKPIGFTTTGSYVDDLGAANNLTYTYSVVPVDVLGNMGEEVPAGPVRVAHDVEIKSELYDQAGNTFTMKDGAAVSVTGIKVTDAGGTGAVENCTVRVRLAGQEEWTDVGLNTQAENKVAYFTKTGAGDTRIWTYDVTAVEVQGAPEGAAVSLLDYPGDRVDFYEGAAVGVLKEAYPYTDAAGTEHTIPAGTVVVVGTYRGDPVYNTVEVQAMYDFANEAEESSGAQSRTMNGYDLLLAEIPEDGQVSDISDGIFLFVPDWAAEAELNKSAGWQQPKFVDPETGELAEGGAMLYPTEIRVVLYRTDNPDGSAVEGKDESRRITSETLWISFPREGTFPQIELKTGN